MRLALTIACTLWALACAALYLVAPTWLGFTGNAAATWYAFGWMLAGALFAVPIAVYTELDNR